MSAHSHGRTATTKQKPNPDRTIRFVFRGSGQIPLIEFLKLMRRDRLAEKLGQEAFTLLSLIALKEDELYYPADGVPYWNDDLSSQVGFSEKSLQRARDAAVKAGWLKYTPGGRSRAAIYWAIVPANLGKNVHVRVHDVSMICPSSGRHSTYVPLTKRESALPTLQEAKTYFTEAGLRGNPKRFFDYYQANGWVQGSRSKPIADWKAAADGWSELEGTFGGKNEPKAKKKTVANTNVNDLGD